MQRNQCWKYRPARKVGKKMRPMRLFLSSTEDKVAAFRDLRNKQQGIEMLNPISVSLEYTFETRQQVKDMIKETRLKDGSVREKNF